MMRARSRVDALFHGTAARQLHLPRRRQGERERERWTERTSERARVGNSSDALCIYRFT